MAPAAAPPEWLDLRTSGSVVSFVETRFDEAGLAAKVSAVIGPVARIEARPIELRTIFTSIARSNRKEAA